MKKYPIGIQSFESIRKEGYVYVDKSAFVYQMAQSGRYFFLSRPWRFGKILLVSTMEAYFSGRKDLFKGLAISEIEKEWIQYPVLRFDLTGQSYTDREALADMDDQIRGKAEIYFQNTMYVMLKLMGLRVDVERHASNGRIDVLIQTFDYVYIIELKRDKDPKNALDQISDKGYDWPFLAGDRKVFKIGASFSTAKRRLEKWEIKS